MSTFNSQLINRGSTILLKIVIFIIGLAVIAFCTYLLYISINTEELGLYRPILIGMCLTSIPFFFGLYEAWKLLSYIDKDEAFSDLSVKALNKIKINAIIISILYTLGMPYIYYVAEIDDAPGVIIIGLVFIAAPIIVAVFSAILQKLLQNAINIKLENDLTV